MHPNLATLILFSGALLLTGCESMSMGEHETTAPPPSQYETVTPPIMQTTPPGIQPGISVAGSGAPTTPGASKPYRPARTREVNHTVGSGESLWSISRKYETTIDEIRAANQISGDMIRAGQVLKIPTSMPDGADAFSADPAASAPSSAATSFGTRITSAEGPPVPPSFANPVKTAPSSAWTVTPPVTPPTSSGSSAPQYRIPEPVIMPPPGN